MRIENELFYAVKNYTGTYRVFFRENRCFVGYIMQDEVEYVFFPENKVGSWNYIALIQLGEILRDVNKKFEDYKERSANR